MQDSVAYGEGIEYTNTTRNNPVGEFPNNYGPVISSDKATYLLGEDIYIKVENSSSATSGGWIGIYDSLNANSSTTTKCWAYTGNSTVDDVEDYIIYGPNKNAGVTVNSELEEGTYYIILMADDGRWAVLPIEIQSSTSISSDKDNYAIDEPIMVTATSPVDGVWVSLLGKNDAVDAQSYYWYYVADHNGEAFNLYDGEKSRPADVTDGEYKLVVIEDAPGGYRALAQKDIFIGTYVEPSITLNKEGAIPEYKYGEHVMATAQASDSSAWVGIYDYDPDFPDGDYARFNVKDVTGSVDLVQLASDAGKPLEYGKSYRVYLSILKDGNPNSWVKQVKFTLLETYGDPTWQWDENYTTATATFTAKHDSAITKTVEVTGDGITSVVTKEATEEEEGSKTHTATITADMIDFTTENDPPFTDSAEEVIPKLSHVHDISPVAANDPTCTEPGNIAYYKCSGCNKYFSDADGTEEIEDKSSVTIKALGHDWSDWTKDQATYDDKNATKTHSRVCNREGCGVKETENCTFELKPNSDPDKELYVCKFCGGQYEQMTVPVITTDKEEYKVGEEILVTTEMNGYSGERGWVALYQRGAAYQTSLYWFYPDCFDKSRPLLPTGSINTDNENYGSEAVKEELKNGLPAGEYELVYLTYPENPYQLVGHPTYFSVVKDIESEEITKDPECTKPGNKHIKYKDGTEEDVEIPALGHDPKEEWTYIAEEKAHYHACSRCDEQLDKTACTFDEGTVTKEPTVKEEGEMTYKCTVCGGQYTEAIPTLEESGVKRVYGSTRYQTALLQADELKDLLKVDKFDAVIVATGTNFADALSGAYLGYVKKAPILLVNAGSVDEVKAYIKENLASGGTIYLLGGPTIVPDAVTAGMSDFTPKRLFGATRYETNIEILKEAGVKREELMICDGQNFADSLSASAAKRPILLVNKALNKAQSDYLDTLRTTTCYLVGGTGVIPVALENDIKARFAVKRLGGQDRYETSVKVAEELYGSASKAVLAYGMNYPDGLCGGTLAAYMGDGAPLLLVRNDKAATTKGYTSAREIKSGIVLGGPTLISDDAARSIYGLNDADEIYVITE